MPGLYFLVCDSLIWIPGFLTLLNFSDCSIFSEHCWTFVNFYKLSELLPKRNAAQFEWHRRLLTLSLHVGLQHWGWSETCFGIFVRNYWKGCKIHAWSFLELHSLVFQIIWLCYRFLKRIFPIKLSFHHHVLTNHENYFFHCKENGSQRTCTSLARNCAENWRDW